MHTGRQMLRLFPTATHAPGFPMTGAQVELMPGVHPTVTHEPAGASNGLLEHAWLRLQSPHVLHAAPSRAAAFPGMHAGRTRSRKPATRRLQTRLLAAQVSFGPHSVQQR